MGGYGERDIWRRGLSGPDDALGIWCVFSLGAEPYSIAAV